MEWTCRCEDPVPDDVALATVPEWFGLPGANAEYVESARRWRRGWFARHGRRA